MLPKAKFDAPMQHKIKSKQKKNINRFDWGKKRRNIYIFNAKKHATK